MDLNLTGLQSPHSNIVMRISAGLEIFGVRFLVTWIIDIMCSLSSVAEHLWDSLGEETPTPPLQPLYIWIISDAGWNRISNNEVWRPPFQWNPITHVSITNFYTNKMADLDYITILYFHSNTLILWYLDTFVKFWGLYLILWFTPTFGSLPCVSLFQKVRTLFEVSVYGFA